MTAPRPPLPLLLWNVLSLNMGWWSCVLGAANATPWTGPAVVTLLIAIHLYLQRGALRREVVTLLGAGVFGYLADSMMILAGAFTFPDPADIGSPSTVWMIALWMNFATAFNLALYWLVKRIRLAMVLGALGGPIAYLAGWKFDALIAPAGPWVLAGWVALQWAIATPLVLTGAARIGRWLGQPGPSERPAQYEGAPA